MSASRVVVPGSKQIPISNDDWILVRLKLSAGERHESYEHMYIRNPDGSFVINADGRLIIGPANSRVAMILSYLIDWSLTAPDGTPLAIRGESLDVIESMLLSLDEESFEEISDAVQAHEKALAKERAAQKKIRSAKPSADPISRLPSEPTGQSEKLEPLM